MRGLLTAHSCCAAQAPGCVGSGVSAPGLQSTSSVVMAHGLNRSAVRGSSFTADGTCVPLHWQVDSYPLDHHEVCGVFSDISKTSLLGPQAIQQAGGGSVWSRRRAVLRAVGGFPGEAWSGSQLCSRLMDHQGRGRSESSCLKMGINAPSNQESPGVLGQSSRELISDSGDIPRAACTVTTS